ncbi:hypothetical protein ACFWNK_02020 [Streptomyces sp. NPDC058417]|uniref:hypothetical protein n=1 Tax=unclassified Streptomyces TaxID=2593676 RepID=UPI00364E7025
MATSSQTRIAPSVLPLSEAPLPQTEFVDRDGDVWIASHHNARGELVLECPAPQDPADDGEGESYPWTLQQVQRAFGPLLARSAVGA